MIHGTLAFVVLLGCGLAHQALGQDGPRPERIIGGPDGVGGELLRPQVLRVHGDLLLVLDRDAPFVKLFALATGRLRQAVGRQGSGPGEFRAPSALAIDGQGQVIVFDPANGRATLYRLRDTLRLEGVRTVPVHVEDACFLGQRLFTLGLHQGHLVHELTPRTDALTKVRSLGRPTVDHPLADHPMMQDRVAQGVLFCEPGASRIVTGSLSLGTVHILELSEARQATITLRTFIPLRFEAISNGLSQSIPSGGEFDEIVGLHPAANGIRVITGRGNLDHHGRDDYLYYSESLIDRAGNQRLVRRAVWRELGHHQGRVVCYRAADYPTVAVFAVPTCP